MEEKLLKLQAPIPVSLHHELRIEAAKRNIPFWTLIRMILSNWKKALQ